MERVLGMDARGYKGVQVLSVFFRNTGWATVTVRRKFIDKIERID